MQAIGHFLIVVAVWTTAIVVGALAISRSMRWVKKRPRAFSSAAWALLFFTSGRMPPPPPASQIEEETQAKKNRESGEGKGG
jgi:predicted permease